MYPTHHINTDRVLQEYLENAYRFIMATPSIYRVTMVYSKPMSKTDKGRHPGGNMFCLDELHHLFWSDKVDVGMSFLLVSSY